MLAEGPGLNQQTGKAPGTGAAEFGRDDDQASPPVVVVHEARDAHLSGAAAHTLVPTEPRPVLSPLAPGDSGLQLFSDDPTWLNYAAPALRKLPVTYQVRVGRAVDGALTSRLKRGVTDYGEFLAATDARLLDLEPGRDWIEVTLNHGKSTTVRRLFTAFGVPVREVRRTGIGPIRLGSLASNQQRDLTEAERAGLPASPVG